MIKSKFALFQVQSKGTFADAPELIEPPFGDGPEVLNAVNMTASIGKLIVSMFDPIVFFITKIYQAIIALKSIRINGRVNIDFLPYNGHQRASGAISDNLGIHFTASLDQPENDVLSFGPSPADPSDPAGTKVAFVDLNFANVKRALLLAVLGNPYSNFIKNSINGLSGKTRQFSNFGRFDIQRKQLNYLSKFGFRNS